MELTLDLDCLFLFSLKSVRSTLFEENVAEYRTQQSFERTCFQNIPLRVIGYCSDSEYFQANSVLRSPSWPSAIDAIVSVCRAIKFSTHNDLHCISQSLREIRIDSTKTSLKNVALQISLQIPSSERTHKLNEFSIRRPQFDPFQKKFWGLIQKLHTQFSLSYLFPNNSNLQRWLITI